ncbi:ABC transporter ATP-binding protein [Desulfobacula toluolica]|uniref:ModC2: molybdate ABC transporter, ATP-binding protein n=1 Tax=Desulfobacula toluolica (strain DSM 7467 / Tol2) TaxID=651182 RepID=K0N622_DESTT|nr:ATP-binding cassette domain-containing protein [Desulfobacula toluolica]CCK79479.1 ModC2: molybdate ABC transporter, ATP-binding protein [Desulfobacula toluolica Tol2]
MTLLEIENLHIHLGEFYLQGISFSLEKGDYLSIIGPTGSGKTILLESIVGFWAPDKGRIIVEGDDLTHELPERRRIGIVYQDYALLPHFTVFKNIAYGLKKIQKHGIKEKIKDLAISLNIGHLLHRKPATLSGGEQQRVALARALAVEPRLLLMDEPFSALDLQTKNEARRLLKQAIQDRGTTVIHITHDLEDAWALANKIAVIKNGHLIQFGAMEEIFHRPNSQFIADFVGVNILDGQVIQSSLGMSTVRVNGFELMSRDEAPVGSRVKVAIRPENIVVLKAPPGLEYAKNILKTTLTQVVNQGNTCLLHLKSQETFIKVLVTHNALEMNAFCEGNDAYAIVRQDDVRIIPES